MGGWRRASMLAGLALLVVLACISCAVHSSSPEERRQAVAQLLQQKQWTRLDVEAGPFVLAAFVPAVPMNARGVECLNVYIEGDGKAWETYTRPSADPTPEQPMALRLAMADPGPAVALARPCQYVAPRSACTSRYWTSHRFAPEVMASTHLALNRLKRVTGANCLRLIGYSGGGAVAALVAAQRRDICELLTVAGNLDHAAWTRHHRLSPLTGSRNPIDIAQALAQLPQIHFVGAEDAVMPAAIAQGFLARQGTPNCGAVEIVAGLDHGQGWPERWPTLLRNPRSPCLPNKISSTDTR